ncbi:DUF6249 domain-containing protein [Caulobacter sp. BK020]|uniref:DUF6249 domain-containing protein n=1 Tax=Caulobacter sp. BK020 TaxID=2512117 RepID=UPI00104437C7|nr:DUF6249 domain-containing protein [Caulobacter sp. BK020]TCS14873.1 hypothetical protein EV278_10660 [Caulobacter sp. BK020]
MDLGILVPLSPFLMVAAIVIVPAWLKNRERREMQQTVRAAIEKGQALPPELIEALSKDVQPKKVSSAHRDLRIGVILLAVSVGMGLLGAALGMIEDEAMFAVAGSATIPGMIGIAFIILSFFNPNKNPPEV